jgi:hypothetical protein
VILHPQKPQGGHNNDNEPFGFRWLSCLQKEEYMLSIQDVLDYCDLDRGEIAAVAEHEHIPMTIAAELGEALLSTPEGVVRLHSMIVENMEHALQTGHYQHVEELGETYKHLQRTHPIPG